MNRLVPLIFLLTFGCGEVLDDATIESLTIDPSIISTSDTGFFSVDLVTSNFDDAIDPDSVVVFRQEPSRVDAVGMVSVDGTSISITMIAKSWFEGVEPGTYNIGAELESESQSVRVFDLATVTVEE